MKTLVLTSRENFVWKSMQEIIPAIESQWLGSQAVNHDVQVVNIDKVGLGDIVKLAMTVDQIVWTCFTVKLSRYAEMLREKLNFDGRYFIHVHNQATIGFWPFFAWGWGKQLRAQDVFISSCRWDAEAVKLTFPKAKVEVIPFALPENDPAQPIKKDLKTKPNFVFSGRISEQKNLHTLIQAYRIFLDQGGDSEIKLILYGGEDNLGHPNMGLKSGPYLDQLKELAKSLEILDSVKFRGFTERQVLHEELRNPHILTIPSLHSDENFGMSALRSLMMGAPAILSHWGGHADFSDYFPGQVFEISVKETGKGPWIDPEELADTMLKASQGLTVHEPTAPSYYQPSFISENMRRLALSSIENREELEVSDLARGVFASREGHSKVFSSYEDPVAHTFFRAYGMGKS